MVPCFFHSLDAVHPENGGERGFLVLVGYQIEVEFRKKEGHQLHGVLPFGSVLPLVVKADDFFLFYEKGNAPQGIQQLPAMPGRHIAEGFVPYQFFHHLPSGLRAASMSLSRWCEVLPWQRPGFPEGFSPWLGFPS